MIRQFEGRRPPSLDLFLEYVGLNEESFTPLRRASGLTLEV